MFLLSKGYATIFVILLPSTGWIGGFVHLGVRPRREFFLTTPSGQGQAAMGDVQETVNGDIVRTGGFTVTAASGTRFSVGG